MSHIYLKPYKWSKTDIKDYRGDILKFIDVKDCQFYNPIYSLYLCYHNTNKSKKIVDIYRKYILKRIVESTEHKIYNTNKIITGIIFNTENNCISQKKIFCKNIPILEPVNYIMNNYTSNNNLLPSNFSFNTFNLIELIEMHFHAKSFSCKNRRR